MREEELHYFGLYNGGVFAGRYEIVRKLGAGGMGMVFEVLDLSLQKERVALKVFSPTETDEDASLRSRFQNEVLITRRLTHPNIVRTFDFAEVEDRLIYMTMEFVDGWSLEQHLRSAAEKRLDVDTTVTILKEVAKGIHYAHKHGVIHRDLKPANVLLSRNGEIKVTDFGLAQSLATRERLTMTGECVGTPAYMSPEQVLGQTADPRSDIYALGMIAFEMVTGKLPFRNKGWFELANQIVNEPIAPFAAQTKHIPGWFENFVLRATEKQPSSRFPSLQSLLESLESGIVPASGSRPTPNISLDRKESGSKSISRVKDEDLRRQSAEKPERPKNSIHLSFTIPASPAFWFAVVALFFVLSTLGVKNFRRTHPEITEERTLNTSAMKQTAPRPQSRVAAQTIEKDFLNPSPDSEANQEAANLSEALTDELESLDSGKKISDRLDELANSDFFTGIPSPKERLRMKEQFYLRRKAALEQQNRNTSRSQDKAPRGYRSIR